MGYSNSSLVSHVRLSPNNSGQRVYEITRITPHCVVGHATVEGLGELFANPSRQASSNYGIDDQGRVGMYVEEKNRSWCSSSYDNDQRAVTIEVASDATDPYTMTATAYNRLIDLCVDICQRYGKKKLIWIADKSSALAYTPKSEEMLLTVHRWFAAKSCPGDWLFNRLGDVAKQVTARLNPSSVSTPTDVYKLNGFKIERVHDFSILYWDKSKKKGTASNYINGGFFGYYKENGVNFTLPVGNLMCDLEAGSIPSVALKYLSWCIRGKKLCYGTNDNASAQFKGKTVSTLVLPQTGTPYVRELAAPPASCRYAISGVPVIRARVDVSYNNFVKPQGWDDSCFYATFRNFIGIKGTSLWVVSGTTKTSNYVATSEVYEKLKEVGFDELICLDGGSSFYHKYNGKADLVWADRNVNNLILY